MPDITLSDGRKVIYDLTKISMREFRSMFRVEQPDEVEYELLSRVTGIPANEIGDLPYPDYRRLAKGLIDTAKEPLADPS